MSQVRKLNENSNRRYQFYDKRIKNLLRKIHTDSRDKPDKNSTEVRIECGSQNKSHQMKRGNEGEWASK